MAELPAKCKHAIRRKVVEQRTGLGRSSLKNKTNPKHPLYDPTFPRSFPLGDLPNSPVAWDEEEVDAWIRSRIALRDTKRQEATEAAVA